MFEAREVGGKGDIREGVGAAGEPLMRSEGFFHLIEEQNHPLDGNNEVLRLRSFFNHVTSPFAFEDIGYRYQHLLSEQKQQTQENRILAVVVLTDGADTESNMKLSDLMPRIQYDGETKAIHVFTIAYGRDARKDILKQISDATQGKSYEGTPQNITSVFRDISTFF